MALPIPIPLLARRLNRPFSTILSNGMRKRGEVQTAHQLPTSTKGKEEDGYRVESFLDKFSQDGENAGKGKKDTGEVVENNNQQKCSGGREDGTGG